MSEDRTDSGTKRRRLAVVGSGCWATELAAAARSLGTPVTACFSPTAAHREAFAARFDCRAFGSLAALACESFDLVCIATPNDCTVEVARQLLDLGAAKALWLEKPAATQLGQLRGLLDASPQARVFVGYDKKFHPATVELRRYLQGGVGFIRRIEASFRLGRYLTGVPEWRNEARHCPLGPFTQLGVHHVDTISWLLGAAVIPSTFTFARQHNEVPGVVTMKGECAGVPVEIISDHTAPEAQYCLKIHADRVYELRHDVLMVDGQPAHTPCSSLIGVRHALGHVLREDVEAAEGLCAERALAVLSVHDIGVTKWRLAGVS